MKNKYLILSLFAITSISALAGCNKQETSDYNSLIEVSEKVPEEKEEKPTVKNQYILKDGVSDYKIVISSNASNIIKVAATELKDFFLEATGFTLPIINDANLLFTKDSKFLSIGNTTILNQTGLKMYDSLGDSGTEIVTIEKSIFMFGEEDNGSLNSVYDLLTDLFDYDFFGKGVYRLNKNVKEIPLYQYAKVNLPDFAYRTTCCFTSTTDVYETYRYKKIDLYTGFFAQVKTLAWHNASAFLEDYIAGHENYWNSIDGTQVCFTARGNKEEYEAMLNAAFESGKQAIIEAPTCRTLNCSINDSHTFCTCDECTRIKNMYGGSNVATNILFCNDLKKKIDEWFETEQGSAYKRPLTISFFAYMSTEEAPAYFDEASQKYVAYNGLHCDPGVVVYYAPIYCDFTRPITDISNKDQYENAMKWLAVSDEMYLWIYDWNFRSYYTLYDTFSSISSYYKFFRDLGTSYIYTEGPVAPKTDYSSWWGLKDYINSKLAWDVDYNIEKAIVDYCDVNYGDASDVMYEILNDTRIHTAYLKETDPSYGGRFSCETNTDKEIYWPKMFLKQELNKFDDAIAALENIKRNDYETYYEIYKRVLLERISYCYLYVKLYNYSLSPDELAYYRNMFKEDTSLFDIGANYGYDDISDAYGELGII